MAGESELPDSAQHLTWWLAEHPLPSRENVRVDELERSPTSSRHIVQIRGREPLHVHERHELEVMLHRGQGTLLMGPEQMELKPGSFVRISAGTPHAFINHSEEPAVAYAVFTPPFDSKDSVEVRE